MSKAKYAVINGKNFVGILWENEKLGKVFVTNEVKIDPNCDIEVRDVFTEEVVNNIDLKDFLLEVIPHEENNDKSL